MLPQERALKYYDGNRFDLIEIAKDCRSQLLGSDVLVANIDGADADSGTVMEVGIALAQVLLPEKIRPTVICIRKEIGINGMLKLADKIIYRPVSVNSLREVVKFYIDPAKEIDSQ